MSKESDLQVLQAMKSEIMEIYELNEKCRKLSGECERLSQQAAKPAPFEFKKAETNEYASLKSEFDRQWADKHKDAAKYRKIFLIANTVIVSLITLLIVADMCFKTEILVKNEAVTKVFEPGTGNNIVAACAQVCLAATLIILPWYFTRKGK